MTKDPCILWQAAFARFRDHQECLALAIESRDDEMLVDLEHSTLDLLEHIRKISKEIDLVSCDFPPENGGLPLTISAVEEVLVQARATLEKNVGNVRVWMSDIQKHLANRRLYSTLSASPSGAGTCFKAEPSYPVGCVSTMFGLGKPIGPMLGEQVDSKS